MTRPTCQATSQYHCTKLHCYLDQKWCKIRAEIQDDLGPVFPTCSECLHPTQTRPRSRRALLTISHNHKRGVSSANQLEKQRLARGYPSVEAMVEAMYADYPYREMAQKLGVKPSAIDYRLKIYNLYEKKIRKRKQLGAKEA